MSWESNRTGSTARRKTFPCLVTFQRNVYTTSNALLLNNNNCQIQPLSVPQPQINPATAVARCWEGSSSSAPFPHRFCSTAEKQQHPRAVPDPSPQPWLQGMCAGQREPGSSDELCWEARSMCSTHNPAWVLFGCREHPGPSSSDQMLLSLRSTCLQDVIGQGEHLFLALLFPIEKKKKPNQNTTQDKKWLLFVSQCTEHGYFAEEEDIYQQMKHRQAKENNTFYFSLTGKKKRLVVYKAKRFIQSS